MFYKGIFAPNTWVQLMWSMQTQACFSGDCMLTVVTFQR